MLLRKSADYPQNRILLILSDIKWTGKFHWAKWVSLLHFVRICSNFFMLAYLCTWKFILIQGLFKGQIWVSHSFYHSHFCSQEDIFVCSYTGITLNWFTRFALSFHGNRTSICTMPSKRMTQDRRSFLKSMYLKITWKF